MGCDVASYDMPWVMFPWLIAMGASATARAKGTAMAHAVTAAIADGNPAGCHRIRPTGRQ